MRMYWMCLCVMGGSIVLRGRQKMKKISHTIATAYYSYRNQTRIYTLRYASVEMYSRVYAPRMCSCVCWCRIIYFVNLMLRTCGGGLKKVHSQRTRIHNVNRKHRSLCHCFSLTLLTSLWTNHYLPCVWWAHMYIVCALCAGRSASLTWF